jgi:PAS domain S-box-containing protein
MTPAKKSSQASSREMDLCSVIEKFFISLSNEKFGAFIDMTNVIAEGVFVVNADDVIEVINSMAAKFFGNSQDALVGQRWFQFLHERQREQYEYIFLNWKNNKKHSLSHSPKEVLLTRADSTWLEADLSISCLPRLLAECSTMFVGVLHNLTDKVEYSELRRLTNTDHLTGLANRYHLEKTLNKSLNDSIVNGQPISLILIDVDYFKYFNDQFGNVNGDKCLQIIAKVIIDCLPSVDSFAARYGGEEFAVILSRSHAADAELIAKQIQ